MNNRPFFLFFGSLKRSFERNRDGLGTFLYDLTETNKFIENFEGRILLHFRSEYKKIIENLFFIILILKEWNKLPFGLVVRI